MSKVVKGIKKAFRSVVKVVKKIWRPLVIAAAVYFTAGAALSYFGAGAASAGVAGATTAAGAAGGSAATAASAIMGSSAAVGATTMAAGTTLGGALAGSTTAAIASSAAVVGQAAVSAASRGAYTRTAMAMSTGRPGIPAAINAATTPATQTPSLLSRVGTAVRGMEGYERAMYVQTLISGVSGLLQPKPPTADQTAQANARFRGSYFGVNEDGQQEFDPVESYNQFWKPRAGEGYRGGMPDNRDQAPAAQPQSPLATAASSANANQRRPTSSTQPRSTAPNTKQQPPSFLEDDENADGNAGAYSPNDYYG